MINLYFFIDENSKIGFEINLDTDNIDHANSILTFIPIYPYFGIETNYSYKILKEMSTIYARLII